MQCTKLKTYMETGRVIFLPPRSIQPNPAQPRTVFPPDALEELAQSIRIHGILQPLTVRRVDSHFQLIAGERRYRAAQMAGLREIPCIVMRMDDRESGLAALLENLQRQDLNFLEEAQGYSAMMSRFSMSQEQIARAVGKSQSAIANKLRLLRHSQPVLEKLMEHRLTERHARALLKLPTEEQKLCAIVHIAHLSVAQSEKYIDSLLKPSPSGGGHAPPLGELSAQLTERENYPKNPITPMLARPMMQPARITPRQTAAVVDLIPMSRKLAPSAPVHAPVPGRGIPTNSIRAMNKPPRPAVLVSFLPAFSPFSRKNVKILPIYFLSLPHSRTFLAKK